MIVAFNLNLTGKQEAKMRVPKSRTEDEETKHRTYG